MTIIGLAEILLVFGMVLITAVILVAFMSWRKRLIK